MAVFKLAWEPRLGGVGLSGSQRSVVTVRESRPYDASRLLAELKSLNIDSWRRVRPPRHLGWSRSQLPQRFWSGTTFSNSVLEKYNPRPLKTLVSSAPYLPEINPPSRDHVRPRSKVCNAACRRLRRAHIRWHGAIQRPREPESYRADFPTRSPRSPCLRARPRQTLDDMHAFLSGGARGVKLVLAPVAAKTTSTICAGTSLARRRRRLLLPSSAARTWRQRESEIGSLRGQPRRWLGHQEPSPLWPPFNPATLIAAAFHNSVRWPVRSCSGWSA